MAGLTPRERSWIVYLNEKPYQLVADAQGKPAWREQPVPTVAGRDVELALRTRTWDTWHLGAGYNDKSYPGTYSYCDGGDLRFPGMMIPPPHLHLITSGIEVTSSTTAAFFEQSGYLYILMGRYCYRYDLVGDTIPQYNNDIDGMDFGAGAVASGAVAFDGSTIIGFTSSTKIYKFLGELSTNGGFETAGAGGADVFGSWAETAGDGAIARTTTAGQFHALYGSTAAAKLTAGASFNTKVALTITGLTASRSYTFSFWTRGDGTYAGRYGIYDVSNSADITAITSTGVTGATYTKVAASFTTPAGCTSVRLDLWCPGTNTGIAYFDNGSLSGWQQASDTIYGAYGTKFWSDNANDFVLVAAGANAYSVATCATGSDPATASSWSAAQDVGDQGNAITALSATERTLWVAKTDGIYYVDNARTPRVVQVKVVHANNGKNMLITPDGMIFYNCKEGLIRYDPTTGEATDVSPGRGLPNAFVPGDVTAMTYYRGWLYIATWDGTNAYLLAGRPREQGEPGLGAMIWHGSLIRFQSSQIIALHVTGLTTNPRLFMAFSGSSVIRYITLPQYGDNPTLDSNCRYASSGIAYFGIDDWGEPGYRWLPVQFDVEHRGADDMGISLVMELDNNAVSYTLGTADVPPRETFLVPTAVTALTAALTAGATSAAVVSATGFPASGNYWAQIDTEIVLITAGQNTTDWTITRAAKGTTAAAHAVGAQVRIDWRFSNIRLKLTHTTTPAAGGDDVPLVVRSITGYAAPRPDMYTMIECQVLCSSSALSNFAIQQRVWGSQQLTNLRDQQEGTMMTLRDYVTGDERSQTVVLAPVNAEAVRREGDNGVDVIATLRMAVLA